MTEFRQVQCPQTGHQEIVEIEDASSEEPEVLWCSKGLSCPNCPRSCLKHLKTVGSMMLTDVPTLQLKDLPRMSVDQVLALFDEQPFSVLPVLEERSLLGSLPLTAVASWQDTRAERAGLSFEQWSREPGDDLSSSWKLEPQTLKPDDCWKVASDKMLDIQRGEIFVTDNEGCFLGIVFADQI